MGGEHLLTPDGTLLGKPRKERYCQNFSRMYRTSVTTQVIINSFGDSTFMIFSQLKTTSRFHDYLMTGTENKACINAEYVGMPI